MYQSGNGFREILTTKDFNQEKKIKQFIVDETN